MSKLAELLTSRRLECGAANPANQDARISRVSSISKVLAFNQELERRLRAMAERWEYSPSDLNEVLERAKCNPAGWERAVALDEEREAKSQESVECQ